MHTITICPRCKKDFMYHQTDYYLSRDVTVVDEVGNNEIVETVICQDCHLEEKWLGKEVKIKEDKYDTHLNKYRLTVESIVVGEQFPITVKIGDTDSYEWFDEEELEIVDSETPLTKQQEYDLHLFVNNIIPKNRVYQQFKFKKL